MEQRLLLTGSGTNDPGEFFYSLTSSADLYNSDHSKIWADDSDIVKLTIEPDGSWQHELFFDGSDVGLSHWEEDINAFTIRDDGSLLISTLGCVTVNGVHHTAGGDILKFTPTSTGRHTAGSWEIYVDGSDIGLSDYEGIDALAELPDGSLAISTQRNGWLPGIGSVRDEDLQRLELTSVGSHTSGAWSRYFDGSDVGLSRGSENVDAISITGESTSLQLSTSGTASATGLYANDEDVFEFQVGRLGSYTSGTYANALTLNGSRAGIDSHYDIDAFHASVGDPSNPQPPVISSISDQQVDENQTLSLTAVANDPDTVASDLSWSVVSGPSSLMIDEVSGQVTWTPEETDGPGTFEVTLAVSDGQLTDTETFLVVVNEVNSAPILDAIPNQTVAAGGTVSFDADAIDLDLPANQLTYTLSGDVPSGANFDTATGQFTWATSAATAANEYQLTVSVSDGELSDSKSFSIVVNRTSGLSVQPISDQAIDELALFQYQVVATGAAASLPNIDFETAGDLDFHAGDVVTNQFAAWGMHVTTNNPTRHPAMIFDSSRPTGRDYDLGTPNRKFGGRGIGSGGKSGAWKNDVARQNILIISEDGDSSDPDDNARGGTLIFTFDSPTDIDDIRLLDVDSSRNTIRMYDTAGQLIGSKNIPKRGNNSVQLLALNASDVSRLEVQFSGSGAITDLIFDRDGQGEPSGPLTYALDESAPLGMTISDTGLIDWTPTEVQGPGTYDINVLVSDNSSTVTETFQITVAEVNVAPTIEPIADQSIDELVEFRYQVIAADTDLPENTLTYSLDGQPSGMTISDTGLITWTATEAEGEGVYSVVVVVSDGVDETTEQFSVTVGEVNVAPVVASIDDQSIDEQTEFQLQVQATDSDLPANTLTYSLASTAPTGMTINGDGLIRWTPSEDQGPNVFSITVLVDDGMLTSSQSFDLTVNEVNSAPVLSPVDPQSIDEERPFQLQLTAVDSDLPTNDLTYRLVSPLDQGIVVSEDGLLTWTPSEAQGPETYTLTVEVSDDQLTDSTSFDLTVNEVNSAPILSQVDPQSVDEERPLQLQLTAVDSDLPTNDLTYRLVGPLDQGIVVDDDGLLTWTPSETQGPETYTLTVEVSDGQLTDSKSFTVTVNEVNRAPEIIPISDVQHPELTQFQLEVDASDSDLPTSALSYELISPVPAGMAIDSNGLISWTPTEAQGPADYEVTVQVSDGQLSDTETFTITVTEQNVAPVLSVIGDQTVFPGNRLTFQATASDIDLPLNALVYSISGDVPVGATIDSESGVFVWDVPANVSLGDRVVTITVDDQNGGLDSETLSITVEGPANPTITLVEDDRFETTASQAIIVPAAASYFEFDILNLSFDSDAIGKASDAFEVALLDADGNSLVHTIAADRDALFNSSERGESATGVNTVVSGSTVRIDLSHIPAGTAATVVYRLVNNDNVDGEDTATTVTVTEGAVVAGDLNTSAGATFAATSSDTAGPVDLSTLLDVTSSLTFTYQQTSFNDDTNTLFADVWVTNNSSQPVDGPFVLVVQNLTDPLVAVTSFDGVTAAGDRFYLMEDLSDTGTIQPGETTLAATLTFINPDESPFDYQLTVLASPNAAPAFTSTPVTLVEAGRPYSYDSNADDPDGDTLAYELLAGPTGMTIDSVTGEISWTPETADLGNHSVVIKASDGRGAFDEQQFTVEVRAVVPNRPPVIISSPVIQTFVATEETQETGNLVVNGDFEQGDTGFASEYSNAGIGVGAAQYSITTDPNSEFFLASSYGDFTTGTGNMLAVNGSTTPGDIVWEQTVAVLPARTYDFAAAISSWFPAAPAALLFTVNGEDIGALNAPTEPGEWEQIFATWDSGDSTSATIRIVNANTVFSGNDFALDDIYFGGPRFSNPKYQYDVNAIDADADPITYSLNQAPDGMSIDSATGLIGWNPNADQLGTHTVVVVADDGRGGTSRQEYEVVVLSDEGNNAPVIISDPIDEFFIPGFSNPASGQVTPQRISLDLGNGETFDGTVSITLPAEAGRFADIVISVDESASMGGDQDWIPGMIPLLDQALQDAGIGATPENPNRFAIVGGGRQNLVSYFFSQQPNTKYTLYGPENVVVAEGVIDEVLPDELLNLQLQDDGRYVLVVEAENSADLTSGIDIGIEAEVGSAVRTQPLQLNTLVSDEFLLPGQPVEYQFSLGTETLLYFDAQTKDVYSAINWSLEGPAGTIANNIRMQNSDTVDATPTYSAIAGDYTLTINAQFDTASDFKFQLLDLSAGTTLTSGETIADEFETKVGTKPYRFSATQGQLFSFDNSTAAVHPGSKWRLVSQSGDVLASNPIGTNQSPMELPYSGQYFLLMEAALWPNEGTAQTRQPSTFEFTAEFSDAAPPTPITLGGTVNGNIDFVGDFVEYSFSLTERSNLYFDSLVNNSMTWQLSGPAGSSAARGFNGSDSFNNETPVLDLVAGNYTLRVNSNNLEGPFAFRLFDLADATDVVPGVEFSGELTVPNETDFYKFNASAGDRFFVDVVTASDTGNTLYRIVDQYGRETVEVRSLSDAPEVTIPTDGVYTLLVEGWRANADQDTYTLNVVPVVETTQALTLGSVTTGSLATPGARAVYTFNLATDPQDPLKRTQLYFDALTNDSNLVWTLEGPRGVEIDSVRFNNSDSVDRADVSIGALAGDWKLTVQRLNDGSGDFAFAVLDLSDPTHSSPTTPNPGSANAVVTITPATGLAANQTQAFRFTANPGDEFSFVTNVTGSVQSYYRLLHENGSEVFTRTFLSTDQLNETLTLGGTYLLLVEGRYNDTDVDDWSIDINYIQNNGASTFTGTPLTLGATTSGDLSSVGQTDAFTFTLSERSVAYFDSLLDSGITRWNLTGPTGVVVSNRGFNASDSFNLADVGLDLIAGDYLLEVYASSGTPGAYSFRLHDVADATPITPGTAFSNTLDPANETHLYRFDANAGDQFYFDVEAASDTGDTLYKLIDPFGGRVFTVSSLSDFGPQQLDFNGTYTLLVEAWRANTGLDTYTMNVLRVPDAPPIPLAFGDLNTGSFSVPGEVAQFTFSLSDYTQVHFDSLTDSGVYRWTLSDSTGTVVNARRFDSSDSVNGTANVIELVPDNYTLTISGDDETQNFAFRLLDVANDSSPISTDVVNTSVHSDTKSTNIFDIDFQAGDRVFFESISTTGFSNNGRWRLFDAFGNEIFDQATVTDIGPFTIETSGNYRLIIEGAYFDSGANGEVQFEVISLGNELTPTPPTALISDEVIDSQISKRYETDRYAFSLTEDTLGYFDSLTNDGQVNWTLTNEFGALVTNRSFNSGTSSLLRLSAGDYELAITSSTVRPYSFAFRDLSMATSIVPGTPEAGELTTANETDLFRFSASQGDEIYLDVVSVDAAGRATLSVVNEFGLQLASSNSIADQDTFTIPDDGQYFVLVEGRINQTVATAYEINIVPTGTVTAALSLGSTQSDSMSTIGQSFEYSFNLPGRSSLYFDSLTDSGLVQWSLAGASGTVVTNRRFNGSDSFDFETPLLNSLAAGDYTLTVTAVGDAVENFSFRLIDIESGTPLTANTSVSGELTIPNETDVYRFDGTFGDQILVDWIAADDTNNSLYRVFDPYGNEIFEVRDLLDRDLPALPFTGTYTLLVEGWRSNTGLDTYQFNLVPSGKRTVSMNIGDTVSETLSVGESIDFTFNAANDMFVHFDSLTDESDIVWSLSGPTGESISNRQLNRSDSLDNTNSVFELRQGDYRLTVDGVTDFAGSFSFSLTDVATATPITPGVLSGVLDPGIESHLYQFEVNAGDNFTFDSLSAGNSNAYYRLVDPFGKTVFTQGLRSDQNNVQLDAPGTYTLLIEGRYSATVSNPYQIDMIFNGQTPPPGITGSTLTLGTPQSGELLTTGQTDSYQFTLSDRSLLHMDVLTNSSAFRWSLRGPRGVEVTNRFFTSTDSLDSATSNLDLFAGDYQLDIFASSGAPGAYRFTLHDFADAVLIVPGTEVSDELTDPTETNLYQFTANKGDRFLIDVVSTNDAFNKEFKLIDQYGSVVATSIGLQDVDQVEVSSDGTYTLLVEGRRNNSGTDTYTLNVVPIATSAFSLNPGTSSNNVVPIAGEQQYSFSLTDPSLLLFTPQTDSNRLKWTVSSTDGTFVDSREFDDGILPIDLPAGDYVLTVDGTGDYTGDAAFTAVIADSSSQLGFEQITNAELTSSNSIAVFQFNGTAGQHFALRPDFNLVFDDAATSAITADDLSTSFDNEDQHSGIDVALRNDVFRDGAAINFITVTDEDRDILDDNVNFETIFTDLSVRGALLNAIVSSPLRDENGVTAIGVDSDGNAYLADGAGGFTAASGGVATTNNISIRQDYIELAWALDGAAWDLGQLRAGGVAAESFTNAFVDVKVAEILEQTSLRLSASEPGANLTLVTPADGVYDNIVGGQQYDFDIQIGNDGSPKSFDLLFTQGQTVGSIPVYIVAPYGYNAMAVDADGDTLTWSITEGPDGLVVDPATGILSWPADSVAYGQYTVTLRVEDGRGGFDEQTFELDVNGGEPASIGGTVTYETNSGFNGQDAVAVNPYLSVLDSPLNKNTSFFLEDFEDGTFDLDGVALSDGVLTSGPFTDIVDSVDADDGEIDGSGLGGESWFASGGAAGITVTFDEAVLGQLPTQAGLVWTDGAGPITFRAFDGNGDLIQEINDRVSGTDNNAGQTAEDIFFGAQSVDGISSLFISNVFGAIEIDHVQYSLAQLSTEPPQMATVFLDSNRNGIQDSGEASTSTDETGRFTFEDIAAGSYVVALEPTPGWQLQTPASGVYEVSIAAGESTQDLEFVNTPISIVNTDPRITSLPQLKIVAGDTFEYLPTFEELDGDDLTFDLPLAPAGMAVNPANGRISWDSAIEDIGPINVLLRVRDGRGGFDLQYFTIDVQQPNAAPMISTAAPAGPAGVGLPYQYRANAVDPDGDTLTWSLTDAPTGATIDSVTGVIRWTPTIDQLGSQDFVVNVDDGAGLSDRQAFSVEVQVAPDNDQPEILSLPPGEAYLANTYLYRLRAIDVNGDPLTFALDAAPSGMSIDADGLISWTPTAAQVGSSVVRVIVEDGRGGSAVQEYDLLVATQPVNQAPQITSIPKTSAVVDQAYNFQPTATDANNDTLVWELVSGPIGMSIDPATGTLHWLPTANDLGSEQVVIRVFDPSAAFSELGYTLNVRAVNTPPVIQTVPLTSAAVGATFLHQVQATDIDGDQLSYSLTTSPAGMVIDPASGLIQWTPVAGQEGNNAVVVNVSDGNGGFADQSFTIDTAAGVSNVPPTITSTPGFFAGVADQYTYSVEANDPEGATLTYQLLQSPTGMTIDVNSGFIEWTPAAADLGTTIVRIVARDPAGAGSVQEYSLTVLAANNAPVISSTPPATVAVGGTYRYDVLASDSDGEFLTYELVNAPAGMLIDGVGRIFWLPTAAETGSNAVEVKVTDPRGGTVTQAFDITVEADTVDPQVAVLLNANPVNVGDTVEIRVSAIDNVGVESLSLTLDGVPVALDSTGLARVPANTLGSITAVATATDAAGNTATDTITIFVSDPNDVEGPVLSITSPADAGIVTGLTDIIGTVTDSSLVEYRLLVAEFGTNDFQQIATGNTNVTDGVLGQLDPTLLANGTYVLRLEAIDAGGRFNVTQQLVEVAGSNKLGNFRVSFTDLVVPVNGIDVVLARTYDSLNSTQDGDFGFGWRMDFRDVQLQVSVNEASDFDKAYGFYTPYRIGTRVYITLPGGERQGFTFSPVIRQLPSIFGPGLVLATPRFIPDAGVTNQLTVQSGQLLLNEFGETTVSGGLPWNPASPDYGGGFTLTTKEGIAYQIDGDLGKVTRVSDPNGNQLNFSDAGVTSNSGISVTFERDIDDRIVGVIDPDGNRISYGYDVSGNLQTVVDRLGNTTTYGYATSPSGYLETITDPLGRTGTRAEYGADGRLTATLDVDGNSTSYTYDPANSVAVRTDANGNSVIVEYDQRGNEITLSDPLGGVIRMTYDSNDNLLTRTDELGNTTRLEYNSQNDVISTTDALGNTVRATFNSMGMPLVSTDAAGNTTKRTYDEFGNLVSTTDPRGATTSFALDRSGNVIGITDAEGASRTATYDAMGNVLTQTDSLGNTSSYQYDTLGNLLSEVSTVTGPNGPETREWKYTYDSNGNLLTSTDPDGQLTEFSYDAAGNRVTSQDAAGAVTTVNYNNDNQVSSVVRAAGSQSNFVYDPVGNLVESSTGNSDQTWREYDDVGRLLAILLEDDTPEDLSDNPRQTFEYDLAGNEIANTDELGNRTEFQYDPLGRLIATIDAAGAVYRLQYDAIGNMVVQTDPLGRLTQFSYDEAGNLTSVEYADGTTIQYVYDSLNRIVSTTDELGNSTNQRFDSEGRLVQVTDAMGGETRYGYDEAGNLISVTDAAGRTTAYEYDSLNRRTATVSPLSYRSEVEYDAVGNPIRQVDADGRVNQNFYDAEGRVIRRELWDASVATFTYDDQGQLVQMTDDTGTSTMTYDVRGRLLSRTNGDGITISYTYDAAGNRTQVATPGGISDYTYDALSRLSTVVSTVGGSTTYTYDLASNLTNTTFADGTREIRSYDSRDRLLNLTTVDGADVELQSFSYSLLANGLIESVIESGAIDRTVRYEYDDLYRLTLESISAGTSQDFSYTYDTVGNRLSKTDSLNGQTTYVYDANDRLLSEVTGGTATTYTYNQTGELLVKQSGSDSSTFTYDANGKLVTTTVVEDGSTRESTYTYTADGLRVVSVVDGIETRYVIDSNRDYSEIIDEYTLAGGVQKHFVVGHSITSVVDSTSVHVLHSDSIGSVRFVTSGGAVTGTSTTDAFGDILLTTGNAAEFPGFAGRSRDAVTGLLDMRARDYDSSTGRFRGSDVFPATVGQPATMHRYVFAANNPVNFTDPTGYFTLAEQLTSTGLVTDLIKTYSKNLGKLFLTAVRISECVIRPGQQLRTMGARLVEQGVPRGEVMYEKGSAMIAAGLTELNTAIKQAYKDIAEDLKKGLKDKWDGLAKGSPKPKATNWLDDMENYFKKQREDFLKKGISEKFKQGEEYVAKLRTYVTDITVMLNADDTCEKAKLVETYGKKLIDKFF